MIFRAPVRTGFSKYGQFYRAEDMRVEITKRPGILAAYLGHGNIAAAALYTKMDATRFDGFWKD